MARPDPMFTAYCKAASGHLDKLALQSAGRQIAAAAKSTNSKSARVSVLGVNVQVPPRQHLLTFKLKSDATCGPSSCDTAQEP